jgi:glycosyltransferase involved in cell wall biosynthesis
MRQPERIAMVSEHASPLAAVGGVDAGGQNVHVAALAAGLARRGVQVVVHTRRDDPGLPERVTMTDGVVVHHVTAGPTAPIPKDEIAPHVPALGRRLAAAWRDDPPDLVHSHFWMSGVAALEGADMLDIPVCHTFHALGTVKRRHQGSADTSPLGRLVAERGLIHEADRIIATCGDEVRELAAMGADPEHVSVVPCGVDLARFCPEGPVEARRRGLARVVMIGRLVPRKGVADAIAALAHLPGVELVVAGGPEPCALARDPEAARLLALAERCGVADRVVLRGQVPRSEVPALLRSADVVACTPWYEPFGIVPLESMACGVPVVATAVGGMLDTVVHGATGLHVPPRRPTAIARAIAALLADPARRRKMGRDGAEHAQRYAWDRIADETLAVYASVMRVAELRRRAAG